jgi:hypothetical protein
VVRSSASRTGRLYSQEMFLVLIFNRGLVDPRTMVRSEVTPPGIGPGTVRLVAQRLNHCATPGPLYLLVTEETNGKMLPKCELGLVYLAHFYVLCPVRFHTLTNTGCWLFSYFLFILFFIVSFIVFICSEYVTYKPNCKMFVLQCYGSNAFRSVTAFYI